jgi:hypothetical protein
VTIAPDTSGEIVLSQGSGSATAAGNTVTVSVSGLTDQSCLQVTVQNIARLSDASVLMQPNPAQAKIALLTGDGLQSNVVNVLDVIQIQQQSGDAVDATNFRFDCVASGVINVLDVIQVQQRSGNGSSCP